MSEELWQEVCLFSITKRGETEIAFDVITDSIDFGFAERQVESAKLINGGRLMLWTPEDDTEISFECYPREVGTTTGANALSALDLKYETSKTGTITTTTPTLKRDLHRATFLWTTALFSASNSIVLASDATPSGERAFRISVADAYVTNVEVDYGDMHLKHTVTLKLPVRDGKVSPNMLFESDDGQTSGGLSALAPYTTTVKFRGL